MGHAAAALSGSMLVHGGRTAPDQALGDLWLLDLSPKRTSSGESSGAGHAARWVCVDAKGTPPATRHRHSAVSVGGSLQVCRELLGRQQCRVKHIATSTTSPSRPPKGKIDLHSRPRELP